MAAKIHFLPPGGVGQGPSVSLEASTLWGYGKIGVHNVIPPPSVPAFCLLPVAFHQNLLLGPCHIQQPLVHPSEAHLVQLLKMLREGGGEGHGAGGA